MNHIKQLINTVKLNLIEYWTLLCLVVGLPVVAYLYVDLVFSFAVFVLVNIVIGLFYLRKAN